MDNEDGEIIVDLEDGEIFRRQDCQSQNRNKKSNKLKFSYRDLINHTDGDDEEFGYTMETFQRNALPVASLMDPTFDETKEPQSGEEYLRLVK